jgi:hypothetical protein
LENKEKEMNRIIKRLCPVCRKKFDSATEKVHGRGLKRRKDIRKSTSVTCSKPCSKIYCNCVKVYKQKLLTMEKR